jgi:hypothetical protein
MILCNSPGTLKKTAKFLVSIADSLAAVRSGSIKIKSNWCQNSTIPLSSGFFSAGFEP